MPPSQPRLAGITAGIAAGITAAICPLLRGRVRRDPSHLGTAFCGNPLSSTMVLQDAEQEGSGAPALCSPRRGPAPAGQECRKAGAVQRQPPYGAPWLGLSERRPPRAACPRSARDAPRKRRHHAAGTGTRSISLSLGSAGEPRGSASTRGGVAGVWAGGDTPVKTRPMLRKLRDFKQLTPTLKSATGKLKRVISLHTLSRVQEACLHENIS